MNQDISKPVRGSKKIGLMTIDIYGKKLHDHKYLCWLSSQFSCLLKVSLTSQMNQDISKPVRSSKNWFDDYGYLWRELETCLTHNLN